MGRPQYFSDSGSVGVRGATFEATFGGSSGAIKFLFFLRGTGGGVAFVDVGDSDCLLSSDLP
jgi:hypothetical protein